jgi:hypothetical protein
MCEQQQKISVQVQRAQMLFRFFLAASLPSFSSSASLNSLSFSHVHLARARLKQGLECEAIRNLRRQSIEWYLPFFEAWKANMAGSQICNPLARSLLLRFFLKIVANSSVTAMNRSKIMKDGNSGMLI